MRKANTMKRHVKLYYYQKNSKHKEAVKTAIGKGLWIFHDLKDIWQCFHKMRIGMFQREFHNDKKTNQKGGGHCSRGSHPWDLQLDPQWWWKGKSVLQIQIYNCAEHIPRLRRWRQTRWPALQKGWVTHTEIHSTFLDNILIAPGTSTLNRLSHKPPLTNATTLSLYPRWHHQKGIL